MPGPKNAGPAPDRTVATTPGGHDLSLDRNGGNATQSGDGHRGRRRDLAAGVAFSALGVFVMVALGLTTDPDLRSSFGVGGMGTDAFQLVLPTRISVLICGGLCLAIGAYQLAVRFSKRSAAGVAVATLVTVALIVWATRGADFSLVGMLQTTVSRTTPLALGAMAGILCEKSGVVNIAIEAMMLFAAFGGVVGASVTGNLWLGLLVGLVSGAVVAYLHAGLSITFRVDQIISGTVLNIVVLGITSFLAGGLLRSYPNLNQAGMFPRVDVPLLSRIPVLGPVLFQQNVFVYLMYVLVPLLTWGLARTRWGLRVRAVGEHPTAAGSVGIDVVRVRYTSVLLGGAMAGLAGSFLSLGSLGSFEANMTVGRGFIALAAMIIGRWNPVGALGAALLFGFTEALQTKLAIINTPIPSQFLLMTPYVVTLLVVAGFIGASRPPAADGVPYNTDR